MFDSETGMRKRICYALHDAHLTAKCYGIFALQKKMCVSESQVGGSMDKYDLLNAQQQEAVFQTEGPVLVLAGAGSGKTRVLTHRTAYLIEEKGVNPYHIMAITFTNKAAAEMRERIDDLVGFGSESIWVSTFHSSCVRILRRYIDRLGYDNRFTIYDADDQKTVMKEVCKRLQIDTKKTKERALLNVISSAKNELISPEEFTLRAAGDYAKQKQAQVAHMLQIVSDMERISDYCENISEFAESLLEKQVDFSEVGVEHLNKMLDVCIASYLYALEAFESNDRESALKTIEKETEADGLEISLRAKHIKRLTNQQCNTEAGVVFLDSLVCLERISDHARNIAEEVLAE